MFDADNDGMLNVAEITTMVEYLLEIKSQTLDEPNGPETNSSKIVTEILNTKDLSMNLIDGTSIVSDNECQNDSARVCNQSFLTIENYLVWTVKNDLAAEFSKFINQICHIVLGLRPQTKSEEGDVVKGWLGREKKASLVPGTIWYLINMDWWNQWHAYVNSQPPRSPFGTLKKSKKMEGFDNRTKGSETVNTNVTFTPDKTIVPTGCTLFENDALPLSKNNSLKVPETTSSSSSRNSSRLSTPSNSPFASRKYGSGIKYSSNGLCQVAVCPGAIDNTYLVQSFPKVTVLTGEGGKLKSGTKIVQGRDFEIIPERLWKALFQWYGGAPALPRQVIRNKAGEIELELRPLSIRILKHQSLNRSAASQGIGVNAVNSMGYGGIAMQYSGGVLGPYNNGNTSNVSPKRYHAYQAGFSRRTNVHQIEEFLSQRLNVKVEDMRMWFYRDDTNMKLLEER